MSGERPRFAWVLNLDAELELARGGPGYNAPLGLLRNLEQYGESSRLLLGPDDVQLFGSGDVRMSSGALGGTEWIGRAWCPTPLAVARLCSAGVQPEPHPSASVLRRVNHRRFAFELGGGLFEQHYVETRAPLESLLRGADHPWLLKRPFGFAGRGQLRIFGSIDEKQWSWIDASLRVDGLVAEPLVEPTLELCMHGFVWRDGRHELGNICVQDVTSRGVFRGVRRAEAGELAAAESAALANQAQRVALALEDAGYFGPFGIDGYRFRYREAEGFCALGEINARYTMGFVTGFSRHPSELVL